MKAEKPTKMEIEEIIRCTCYKCKHRVVKRLLMIVNEALASSEAKHESEVKKLWRYFRRQMARKQAKLTQSGANIQEAYEQGVKDAIVDGKNELTENSKELEAIKRVNKTLNDSLQSNSRDFWKAEAIRLKKENKELSYFKDCRECVKVNKTLSDLKGKIKKLFNDFEKENVVVDSLDVLELLEEKG